MKTNNTTSNAITTSLSPPGLPTTMTDIHNMNANTAVKQQTILKYTTHLSNIEPKYQQLDPKVPIIPYGTEFPSPDPTMAMCIVMQNTQYAMQLLQDKSADIRTRTIGFSI
jgi:hypothetical protein